MQQRMTAAQKQAAYRAREVAKRLDDAQVATAARGIIYWLERAREQGVKEVTLPVGPLETPRNFVEQLAGIAGTIGSAVAESRMGETAGKGSTRRKSGAPLPASLSALDSTVPKQTRRKRSAKTVA